MSVKSKVVKQLKSWAGKAKDEKSRQKLVAAFRKLKQELRLRERQAVAYAKKNPEKALLLAALAGAAAGSLRRALRLRR